MCLSFFIKYWWSQIKVIYIIVYINIFDTRIRFRDTRRIFYGCAIWKCGRPLFIGHRLEGGSIVFKIKDGWLQNVAIFCNLFNLLLTFDAVTLNVPNSKRDQSLLRKMWIFEKKGPGAYPPIPPMLHCVIFWKMLKECWKILSSRHFVTKYYNAHQNAHRFNFAKKCYIYRINNSIGKLEYIFCKKIVELQKTWSVSNSSFNRKYVNTYNFNRWPIKLYFWGAFLEQMIE